MIGFCGVDDTVSPELLELISSRYSWVEWGVLFRTDLEGTGRYASWSWVERLTTLRSSCGHELKLAAHLCGNRCEQVLGGDASFASKLHSLGFNRIQINPTAANSVRVDDDKYPLYAEQLKAVMESLPMVEWLFQLNSETRPIWESILAVGPPANVSILNDASCGKGVQIQEFPSPQQFGNIRCGYAGGIGPKTIASILDKVVQEVTLLPSDTPVWVDMESSLRSVQTVDGAAVDTFDINKTMACISIAVSKGMPTGL